MMTLNWIILEQINTLVDAMKQNGLEPTFIQVGQNSALVLEDALRDFFRKDSLTLDSARYLDMDIIVNPFIHRNAIFVTPSNRDTALNVALVREINLSAEEFTSEEEEE